MGLITESNEEYYSAEKVYPISAGATQVEFKTTFNTELVLSSSSAPANFYLQESTDGGATWVDNTGTLTLSDSNKTVTTTVSIGSALSSVLARIILTIPAKWNNYGGYEYISLNEVINNFIVAYVGDGKLIPNVKRTDVMFFAKRGVQEFSYDTLKSIKSQELTIPASLSVIIPQDYVNYVELARIDNLGVKHIIYPANNLTTNPYTVPLQDTSGVPAQDSYGSNIQGTSQTNEAWATANDLDISGNYNWNDFNNVDVLGWNWWKLNYGQRYGLDPQYSQGNGWFTINEREGKFSFSSNLNGSLIVLQYISDGVANDADTKIPKMAEEAMYMHILYSILASRANIPEYVVRRYKIERRAALRNAKIRLSNIKLEEISQVMRGKSKWIKH